MRIRMQRGAFPQSHIPILGGKRGVGSAWVIWFEWGIWHRCGWVWGWMEMEMEMDGCEGDKIAECVGTIGIPGDAG